MDIKIPSVGESITEVIIAEWVAQSGQQVTEGEVFAHS